MDSAAADDQPPPAASPESHDSTAPLSQAPQDPGAPAGHQPPPPATESQPPPPAAESQPPPAATAPDSYESAADTLPRMNPAAAAAALEALAQLEHGIEQVAREAGAVPVRAGATFGRGTERTEWTLQYHAANGGDFCPQGRGRGGKRQKRGRVQHSDQLASKSSRSSKSKSTSKAGKSAKAQPPVRDVFWCDVCRVECNNAEIFELHKNGKRHKKTVQKLEEIQARQKQFAEYEANYAMDMSVTLVNQPEQVNESQAKAIKQLEMVVKRADEHLAAERSEIESCNTVVVESSNVVTSQHIQSFPEQTAPEKMTLQTNGTLLEAETQKMDGQDISSSAPKRKKAAGRGGKRLRMSGTYQQRPHVKEQPVICTLCNVTCDTRAVFECHLVGRKHMHRVKQFQGGEAVHGPLVYFLQPHSQVSTSNGMSPLLYGFQSHIVPQQVPQGHYTYMLGNYTMYRHPYEGQAPFPA